MLELLSLSCVLPAPFYFTGNVKFSKERPLVTLLYSSIRPSFPVAFSSVCNRSHINS